MTDTTEPKPGERRVINGNWCEFIERELEGDKWAIIGPAATPVPSEVREAVLAEIMELVEVAVLDADIDTAHRGGPAVYLASDALRDKIAAVLALLTPAGEGWRPVSEAPEDGRWVVFADKYRTLTCSRYDSSVSKVFQDSGPKGWVVKSGDRIDTILSYFIGWTEFPEHLLPVPSAQPEGDR